MGFSEIAIVDVQNKLCLSPLAIIYSIDRVIEDYLCISVLLYRKVHYGVLR